MTKVINELTAPNGKGSAIIDAATDAATNILNNQLTTVNPLKDLGKYLVGGRATIKINGKLFGFAFGVNFNIQTDHTEIITIDDYLPYEFAPSRISISGTLGMFHIPGRGPSKQLVQSNQLSFLSHRYITIEITDQTTQATIFKSDKCVITGRQQNIQEGQISTIQLSWKAIGWRDEMIPQTPTDPPAAQNSSENITGQSRSLPGNIA